ncbi:hypothetical protein Tco_1418711 [Tanacetum coccineum]
MKLMSLESDLPVMCFEQTRSQIPEDDLDNVHSLREVDGTLVFVEPQDLLGSCLLANIDSYHAGLTEGCDPLSILQ